MNYVIRQTAAAVVAAASDFIKEGRAPTPSTQIEGPYASALESQRRYDRAIGSTPISVELLNSWTIEARIGWMLNNFQADERYAHAWGIGAKFWQQRPSAFRSKSNAAGRSAPPRIGNWWVPAGREQFVEFVRFETR
jgi:hypothetical protein